MLLHSLEGCFLLVAPVESLGVALGVFGFRGDDRGEILHKTSVEIGETNKDLDFANTFWAFPAENRIHLG